MKMRQEVPFYQSAGFVKADDVDRCAFIKM